MKIRIKAISYLFVALILMFGLYNWTSATVYNWTTTKIYTSSPDEALAKGWTGLDIDSSGDAHIFFVDDDEDDGRTGAFYAYEVGSGGDCDDLYGGHDSFECALIDSNGANGEHDQRTVDLELSSSDIPHAVYTDGVDLYYATCSSSCGNPGNWTTTKVDSTAKYGQIDLNSSNNPSIVYKETTGNDLMIAKYVGSGGSGCDSSAWTCTAIESTDTVANNPHFVFDSDTEQVVFGNNTDTDVIYATFVGGGGGSGCSNSDWTCTTIDSSRTTYGPSIVFDSNKPRVAYLESNNIYYTSCDSSCTNSSNWSSPYIVANDGDAPSIATDYGTSFISFGYDVSGDMTAQYVAEYVGSGGDCDAAVSGSSAWKCYLADNSQGSYTAGGSSLHMSNPKLSWGTSQGAFYTEGQEEIPIPELPKSNTWKVLIALLALGLVIGIAAVMKKKKK